MGFETGIKQLEASLRHCTSCGGCLAVCPSFRATGDEAQSARGRVTLLKAVAAGRLGFTTGLARRLSTCLECGACTASCPAGVALTETILEAKTGLPDHRHTHRALQLLARHLAVADGSVPVTLRLAGALKTALPAALKQGPLAGRRPLPHTHKATPSQKLPELSRSHRPQTRVAFFPGCAAAMMYPDTGMAAVRVLNAAGADVVTPRGLSCCGQPLKSLGDPDAAADMLSANLKVLSGIDADAIVTICSSCALMLKEGLPRLDRVERPLAENIAAKVMDIHQWLADWPLTGLKEGEPLRVTWHDPCHLRWGLGLTEEPRRIIKAIPGVEYIETGQPGGCCGGGGLFSFFQPELSTKIGRGRTDDIIATGAKVVLTGCPSCQAQLTEFLARAGKQTRVMHTVELIAARLPVPAFDGASRLQRCQEQPE